MTDWEGMPMVWDEWTKIADIAKVLEERAPCGVCRRVIDLEKTPDCGRDDCPAVPASE